MQKALLIVIWHVQVIIEDCRENKWLWKLGITENCGGVDVVDLQRSWFSRFPT
jgi:hypothetical protein